MPETISDLTVENQVDTVLDALNNFKEVNLLSQCLMLIMVTKLYQIE